jgi:hypothetical protein
MNIGINIDDKELKKNPHYYVSFLEKLEEFYPRISTVELTYNYSLLIIPFILII